MLLRQRAAEAASKCCGDRLSGCCVAAAVDVMAGALEHVRALAACNASRFEITQYIGGLGIESESLESLKRLGHGTETASRRCLIHDGPGACPACYALREAGL